MISMLEMSDAATSSASESLPVWFDLAVMTINGIFGAAVARSLSAPIYGTLLGGILVGLGGGMIRDVLLGLEPVAISSWIYIPAVLVGAIVGGLFFGPFVKKPKPFVLLNGITLGFLVTIGAQRAIAYDAPFLSAVFLGVVTASFGGALSDVLMGKRASITRQAHWLASALTLGALVFVPLSLFVNFWVAVAACVIVVTTFRYVSTERNWPSPSWPGENTSPKESP